MTLIDPLDGEARRAEVQEDPGGQTYLLLGAMACVVAGAVALIPGTLTWHAVGYGLASVVAFTLTGAYRRAVATRIGLVGVAPPARLSSLATSTMVAGIVVASLQAWYVAQAIA